MRCVTLAALAVDWFKLSACARIAGIMDLKKFREMCMTFAIKRT